MRRGRLRRDQPNRPPSPFLHRPGAMLTPNISAANEESRMRRKTLAVLTALTMAGAVGLLVPVAAGAGRGAAPAGDEPGLDPAGLVRGRPAPDLLPPGGRTPG